MAEAYAWVAFSRAEMGAMRCLMTHRTRHRAPTSIARKKTTCAIRIQADSAADNSEPLTVFYYRVLRAKSLAVRRINDSQSSAPRQFKCLAKNVDTIRIQANELEAIDRHGHRNFAR